MAREQGHFAMEQLVFTQADRAVLASYASMLDGLGAYLGSQYELVLYSLEDTGRSVVKIVNGQYTGRQAGAPISGIAMSILDHIQDDGGYISYTTDGQHGEKLRFIAIAIQGEGRRTIGLLCINAYRNASPRDVMEHYFENPVVLHHIAAEKGGDVEQMIRDAVCAARQQVEKDAAVLPSMRNREIIARLKEQGVFRLKNAVVQVADLLGISKNTVYMHLRNTGSHSRE